MYFKRFLQLFIIFAVVSAVLSAIFITNFTGNWILTWVVAMIVGYIVLTIPLVILTIAKANKKANIVGNQAEKGELTELLKTLPGYIALNLANATTIMSFTQDTDKENVWYMVSDLETTKVKAMSSGNPTATPKASFTTWFDTLEDGARLSSNKVSMELIKGDAAKQLTEAQPNILDLHENAANMGIFKMTIHSALFENFKDGIKVLNFE